MNLLKDVNDNQLDESVSKFKKGDVVKLKASAISALNKIEPGKFSKDDLKLTFKVKDIPYGDKKGTGYKWRWRIQLNKPLKDETRWDEKYFELASVNESEKITEIQAVGQAPKIDLTLMAKVNDESAMPTIKQDEVHDILNKAKEEAEEEVETVTFGLETDDDEIVKVYVNAKDADGFEEAMSKLLGSEDSIEAALEKLSIDFDIVAVDWPDDEEETIDDEENENEQVETTDELLDFSSEETEEEPKTEGEETMTIGNSFLKRILGEDLDEELMEKKTSSEDEDIEDAEDTESNDKDPILKRFKFQSPLPKMILETFVTLNIPKLVLIRNFSAVRNGIISSARMIQKNPRAKMWLNRFNSGLSTMSELSEAVDIKDEVTNVGVKKISSQLFDVLVALGIPEDNFSYGKADLRSFFRDTSLAIQKNSRMRMILKNIHTALGLSDDEGNRHNFDASAAEAVKEEVDIAADTFINDIESLMSAIGIPDENLKYKRNQVRKALMDKKKSLKNIQLIKNRMESLVKLINDNTITEEIDVEKKSLTESVSFKKGDKVKHSIGDSEGELDIITLTSDETTDDQGNKGYYYQSGKIKGFAYTSALKRDNKLKEETVYEVFDKERKVLYDAIDKLLSGDGIKKLLDTIDTEVSKKKLKEVLAKLKNRLSDIAKDTGINLIRLTKNYNELAKLTEAIDTEETEIDADVEKAAKTKKAKKAKLNPLEADWSIATIGSGGMTMSSKKMKIKLSEIEVEKLTAAFGDNKVIVVKGQAGKKFSFRPYRKGNENTYIVKQMDDDTYPDGILLNSTAIDAILSAA